jgi:gustatory receptor
VKAYGAIFRNRDDFTEIIAQLDEFLPRNNKEQKEQKVAETLRYLNMVMIGFFALYVASVVVFDLMPFLVILYGQLFQDKIYHFQQPFKGWYPFNELRDYVRVIVYIHQVWAAFSSLFLVVGTDCLFCVCISIICIRFDKLKKEIESLQTFKELKSCVKVHTHLIELSERLDKMFSASILFNIIAASVIICLTGFESTVMNNQTIEK